MKQILILTLTFFSIIGCNKPLTPTKLVLPSPGVHVENPGFKRTQCPFGMSGIFNCEIKAEPWFCANGTTPDGIDICDSIWNIVHPTDNTNLGNFASITRGIGFFNYILGNDPSYPEWVGTPLLKPINPGCSLQIDITVKPSDIRQWVGGFYAVIGDTFEFQPQPVNKWQTLSVQGFTPTGGDTLYIGGWNGSKLPFIGWLNSSYIGIAHVRVMQLDCP